MIRSVAFPIIVGTLVVLAIGYMVAPHVTQGFRNLRDSRSGRLTADALAELSEWRRRRRNPRRVAAFGHPREDESLWLTTVPLKHLSRPYLTLRRMYRKGRLTGENITRARVVRQELRRRLRAADSPNRAVMDQLDDSELGFIRQQLNERTP